MICNIDFVFMLFDYVGVVLFIGIDGKSMCGFYDLFVVMIYD